MALIQLSVEAGLCLLGRLAQGSIVGLDVVGMEGVSGSEGVSFCLAQALA